MSGKKGKREKAEEIVRAPIYKRYGDEFRDEINDRSSEEERYVRTKHTPLVQEQIPARVMEVFDFSDLPELAPLPPPPPAGPRPPVVAKGKGKAKGKDKAPPPPLPAPPKKKTMPSKIESVLSKHLGGFVKYIIFNYTFDDGAGPVSAPTKGADSEELYNDKVLYFASHQQFKLVEIWLKEQQESLKREMTSRFSLSPLMSRVHMAILTTAPNKTYRTMVKSAPVGAKNPWTGRAYKADEACVEVAIGTWCIYMEPEQADLLFGCQVIYHFSFHVRMVVNDAIVPDDVAGKTFVDTCKHVEAVPSLTSRTRQLVDCVDAMMKLIK